jgi:hypothetical protein
MFILWQPKKIQITYVKLFSNTMTFSPPTFEKKFKKFKPKKKTNFLYQMKLWLLVIIFVSNNHCLFLQLFFSFGYAYNYTTISLWLMFYSFFHSENF